MVISPIIQMVPYDISHKLTIDGILKGNWKISVGFSFAELLLRSHKELWVDDLQNPDEESEDCSSFMV